MKVESLSAYVDATSRLASRGQPVWFRGIRRHSYRLTPSLYRLGDPSWTNDHYLDLEERLIDRFEERSLPYRTREAPSSRLAYLFEMQHYGAPTRLLDWSENAIMALWFALEVSSEYRTRVWALNASRWNECLYPSRRDVRSVLSPSNEAVKGWLPWETLKRGSLVESPVCIYGMHNSTRIVGQRGVFTLSGTSRASMEDQAVALASAGGVSASQLLTCIDVPTRFQSTIRNDLFRLGFTRSMVYPDLVGLAQELTEKAREGVL